MALQRLIETYSFDSDTYNKIVTSHKITESEILKISGGKLSEETKSFMAANPVSTLTEKKVWRFPVSRYDWKNANGRVYEKRLWQRVIDEQKDSWQGNVGLADHPLDEEDGSFRNVAIVWLNMGLNESEKLVWAEGIFVGQYGTLAEEVMEAGGRVGFSSSGFGELDESDDSTVRWDTYMLERASDLVLNPSQKVYGRKENKITPSNIVKESVINNVSENVQDSETPQENITMSEVTNTSKMSRHEVRRFREDILAYMSEINSEDLQEKLSQLEEIKSYFSPSVEPKLLAEVEKQIEETRLAIDNAIKEHGKIAKTFGVSSVEELKEGVKNIVIDTQMYERNASDWKGITEGLQDKVQKLTAALSTRPTVEAYKTLLIQMQTLKEEAECKDEEDCKEKEDLENEVKESVNIQNKLLSELDNINEENIKLREHNAKLVEYSNSLKTKLGMFRESQKAVKEVLENKKLDEETVSFRPKADSRKLFEGFNQSSEVEEYYEDLESRYGEDIKPYADKILGCKSLKEAMYNFNKIFSKIGKDKTEVITEALESDERRKIIESTTGVNIRKSSRFSTRMPDSWE